MNTLPPYTPATPRVAPVRGAAAASPEARAAATERDLAPAPADLEPAASAGQDDFAAGHQAVRFARPANDPAPPGRRYCLITPCRDEEVFAEATIRSVAQQTEPPSLWVVVDDGSTDRTPEILREWQRRLPYLRVLTRPDRGDRKLGSGVIEAFNEGYRAIDPGEFDFICKFDLDLELPATYFADVMNAMERDPRLGTFSGKPYFRRGQRLISEMCGDENAVGMIKFYRVAAYEQIGGFVRELMWDGIDGHRCRMLGWRAQSSDDPRLRFIHLRPMGTSHKSWWTGRQRHGRGQYFMGTGPLYMLASAVYRMSRPPRLIGGVAMFWGYVKGAVSGMRRYDDPRFRRFLRRYQWLCLLMGKRRATRKVDAEQAAVFHPPSPLNR